MQKVKIIFDPSPQGLEYEINEFLKNDDVYVNKIYFQSNLENFSVLIYYHLIPESYSAENIKIPEIQKLRKLRKLKKPKKEKKS